MLAWLQGRQTPSRTQRWAHSQLKRLYDATLDGPSGVAKLIEQLNNVRRDDARAVFALPDLPSIDEAERGFVSRIFRTLDKKNPNEPDFKDIDVSPYADALAMMDWHLSLDQTGDESPSDA